MIPKPDPIPKKKFFWFRFQLRLRKKNFFDSDSNSDSDEKFFRNPIPTPEKPDFFCSLVISNSYQMFDILKGYIRECPTWMTPHGQFIHLRIRKVRFFYQLYYMYNTIDLSLFEIDTSLEMRTNKYIFVLLY